MYFQQLRREHAKADELLQWLTMMAQMLSRNNIDGCQVHSMAVGSWAHLMAVELLLWWSSCNGCAARVMAVDLWDGSQVHLMAVDLVLCSLFYVACLMAVKLFWSLSSWCDGCQARVMAAKLVWWQSSSWDGSCSQAFVMAVTLVRCQLSSFDGTRAHLMTVSSSFNGSIKLIRWL